MKLRVLFLVVLLTSPVGFGRKALWGQVPDLIGPVTTKLEPPMAVPFGPGERLEYDVKLGWVGKRGEGFMQVGDLESVRGRTTYHVTMAYGGGFLGFRVNDQFDSWFDVTNLVTLRSIENTQQLSRKRYKHFEFYPERRFWERIDNGKSEEMPTSEPLDQISFFYFARTLPLEVGEVYTLNRYFKESGNPVILRVLRKDTVEVPAGTFPTIVVQPIIQSSGAFGEGGKAELHFSDDERRLLVLMNSDVPIIGRLSLHLKNIREGSRIGPLGEARPEEDPAELERDPGVGP
ncbi:MAG: DUF3108 domain-containing protein [Gemmatimonadota bacterium]|jgi:hypothetical protein